MDMSKDCIYDLHFKGSEHDGTHAEMSGVCKSDPNR